MCCGFLGRINTHISVQYYENNYSSTTTVAQWCFSRTFLSTYSLSFINMANALVNCQTTTNTHNQFARLVSSLRRLSVATNISIHSKSQRILFYYVFRKIYCIFFILSKKFNFCVGLLLMNEFPTLDIIGKEIVQSTFFSSTFSYPIPVMDLLS